MQLDQAALDEFISLYKKLYGVKLNTEQAMEYGTRLITLVKAVYGNNLPEIPLNKLNLPTRNNTMRIATG